MMEVVLKERHLFIAGSDSTTEELLRLKGRHLAWSIRTDSHCIRPSIASWFTRNCDCSCRSPASRTDGSRCPVCRGAHDVSASRQPQRSNGMFGTPQMAFTLLMRQGILVMTQGTTNQTIRHTLGGTIDDYCCCL
ncbi:hypothetical protein ACLKA6_010487 [Drosophila palustris]